MTVCRVFGVTATIVVLLFVFFVGATNTVAQPAGTTGGSPEETGWCKPDSSRSLPRPENPNLPWIPKDSGRSSQSNDSSQWGTLILELPEPPPSHVRCSVDADDGRHIEFEWEPGGLPSLVQSAVIKYDTSWKISCLADPYFLPQGPRSNAPLQNAGWVICNGSAWYETNGATNGAVPTERYNADYKLPVWIAPDVGAPQTRVQRTITASVK
ncbi:MAG: hypothetical protein HUU55_23580, partial [Myxococcales bacterium]|nr:hypothetical protein [Myxococcales bacterium]